MNQIVKQDQNIVTLDEAQNNQNALTAIESARSTQEVIASVLVAKRCPRNERLAIDKIMHACLRPGLASEAMYAFPKGGSTVTGPSIRLAEVLKQYWGNIDSGWREIERQGIQSTVMAYAWDKETNTRAERVFTIKQSRSVKEFENGKPTGRTINKPITDERDIYENNANQAARRMRACILELIPGDIIDDAVFQCEETLKAKEVITAESIAAMLKGFAEYSVTKDMIEEHLGRKLTVDSLSPAMMIKLRAKFKSLKDGVAKVSDFFIVPVVDETKKPAAEKKEPSAKKKETKPAAEVENKDQLENFKEKHADKKPAADAGKCATCEGHGKVTWTDGTESGIGPCEDCKGTGKAQ